MGSPHRPPDHAHFLASVHAPMWDVMCWDNSWSPNSNPQMHTIDSLQTHDTKQHQTANKHGNNYKKVPQDALFIINPGLHPGLPDLKTFLIE